MLRKNALLSLFLLAITGQSAAESADEDEHIRQVVQGMLKEKDQKIQQFEARIQQLEQELRNRGITVQSQKMPEPAEPAMLAQKTAAPETSKVEAPNKSESAVDSKLQDLDKKIEELKETASAHGLNISGFFDVNAKTGNATDKTFHIGTVEVDLDYAHSDHFGASTALVFDGENTAEIGVALLDFHSFSDRIPPRGRIFNNQGFHVQAGRFDVPFGIDYQYFAIKDRVTATEPLTTSRMQAGGYNGDGLRSYGSWNMMNYAVFWTNSLYADGGHSVGGRLALDLAQRRYSVHRPEKGIEIGISHLSDLDGDNRIRNTVYGADLSMSYGLWHLENELMLRQAHDSLTLDADNNPVLDDSGKPIGKAHQLGYHSTLVVDLNKAIKQPVRAFARYSRWQPKQRYGLDEDGHAVAIANVSMLTLGFNYTFSDYLQLKSEYNDSLGTATKEQAFDKKVGIGQMVLSF